MKRIIAFLAVIILIAATTSAFAVVSGYVASGGGGVVNIFQANGNFLTTVSNGGKGVTGVSFAQNGDLYFGGHWNNGGENKIFKSAYLGNGTWEAVAALYASIPSTYGNQGYNFVLNLAAKSDGTVYVGTYDTGIYKIIPGGGTGTEIVTGNGMNWLDMDICPDGVDGDFVAIQQTWFLKSYNADGSEAGFNIDQFQNRVRFTAFANGNLYASFDNWDTIYQFDLNNDSTPGIPYITLTISSDQGTNYFQSGAYGPDNNGDGYGDFYVMHFNDVINEIQVYSGAPGLAPGARYLTAFGSGIVGNKAVDAFVPSVPEPGTMLALLSFIAPTAIIFRKRRA